VSVERSVEQAARNESAFRGVNERLEEKAEELELRDGPTPFLCECEDEGCTDVLLLERAQYEEVRAHPKRFVVTPGHQAESDQVVSGDGDFAVIEKHGEEGELVARQDPRSTADS
jgi:hypothetical protein